MCWPEAALALERSGSTLVWPFGAFEQHGPQLPLLTDALFAERIPVSYTHLTLPTTSTV